MNVLLLPWAAALASPPLPQPTSVILPDSTHLTVLTLPETEVVAVQAWIASGNASDPEDAPGLAHLLEHVLVGSGAGALESQLAPVGGTLNAFTGADYTRYAALLPPEALGDWLAGLVTRLDGPLLSEAELQHERAVVLEELRGRRAGALGRILQQVDAQLWPSHPYGRLGLALEADLAGVTLPMVVERLEQQYAPAQRHLIVAGPVELAAVVAALPVAPEPSGAAPLPALVPALPPLASPPELPPSPGVYRVGALAWALPPTSHPDYWALRVGLEVLEAGGGARWQSVLPGTEALQVGVEVTWHRQGGRLLASAVYAGTRSPERIRAELEAARATLSGEDWLTDALAQAALRTASRRLWGACWDLEESARWLGWSSIHQGAAQGPAQLAAAVDALTPSDVRAAWQRWIGAAAPVQVLLSVG